MRRTGWKQLRVLALGLIAGPLLTFAIPGIAAGGIDEIFTHLESGPSPASIPNGSYATYAVHVGNIGDAFDDVFADHDFSIVAATGLGGLTVVSPCVQISIWTVGGGIISDVRVYTNPAFTPTGTHTFDLVIQEWDSQGSCTSVVRDLWHVSATITVTDPVAQTISFADPPDTTFGVAPFSLGATASSGLAVGYSTSGPCSQSSGTLSVTGVGTCSITASQAGGGGWAAATPVTQSFAIAAAPLTITIADSTKTYGDPNPTFSSSISGFVNGEDAGDLTGTLTYVTSATDWSPVGPYPVGASGLSNPHYSIGVTNGTLTINPAGLTVTANDASKQQGDPNPAFSATITGFVLAEDETTLTTPPTCDTTADDASPMGTYAITCSGTVAPNYNITHVDGTLTVLGGIDHVVISPDTATITAGGTQAYTAEAFDGGGGSLGDVTADTTFSIAGGSCTLAVCGSTVAGAHTVTGTFGLVSDTATLNVTAAAPDHLVISPAGAYVLPGTTQTYTVELVDQYGNSHGDYTAMTTFSISGAGSCTGAACGSSTLGDYAVSAEAVVAGIGTFTGGTTLHVVAALPTPPPNTTPPPTSSDRPSPAGGSLPLEVLLTAISLCALSLLTVSRRLVPARR